MWDKNQEASVRLIDIIYKIFFQTFFVINDFNHGFRYINVVTAVVAEWTQASEETLNKLQVKQPTGSIGYTSVTS